MAPDFQGRCNRERLGRREILLQMRRIPLVLLALAAVGVATGCGARKGRSGFVPFQPHSTREAAVERTLNLQHLRVGYDLWFDRSRKVVYFRFEPREGSQSPFQDPECVGVGSFDYRAGPGRPASPDQLKRQVSWRAIYQALRSGSDTRKPQWVARVRHCLWQLGEPN